VGNIYLLRHGKVNGPAALYGQTDIGVSTTLNNDMLCLLMKNQDKFSHLVTSPLKRCAELAQRFTKETNKPLEIVTNLQEMNFGDYDGLAFDDIPYTDLSSSNSVCDKTDEQNQPWRHLERFWQNPAEYSLPNAEKLNDFYLRVEVAWLKLLTDYANENVLLVTHGGVVRMILAHVLDLDWKNEKIFNQLQVGNASVTHITSTSLAHLNDANSNEERASYNVQVKNIAMPLSCLLLAGQSTV